MKKSTNIILFLILFCVPANGQQVANAKISFEKDIHNFDTINIDASKCSCTFIFTNTGTAPLIINDVISSCGCTVPEWSKKPTLPGKSGSISVSYNPSKPGSFTKTILIKSNATNQQRKILQIKGYVASNKPCREKH